MKLTAKALVRLLLQHGFVKTRQKGSHCRFVHPDGRKTTVPVHDGDLGKGLYYTILKQAGIPQSDFKK
jgi:predicted RNA binding protein YcfA (HicA-like mRNA interferase family)